MFYRILLITAFLIFANTGVVFAKTSDYGDKFYLDSLNEALENSLEDYGVLPPLRVEEIYLLNNGSEKLVSTENAAKLHGANKFSISKLELNDATSRFVAHMTQDVSNIKDLGTLSPGNALDTFTVRGKVVRLTEVPVLTSTLHKGDVISKNDIDWITFPERKLRSSIILSEKQIIGKTPRHRILANKVIREKDVEKPILVQKGEAVTIMYQTKVMKLQTVGRALEDGRLGESIKIRNPQSNKTIHAIVEDEGLAVVNYNGLSNEILASNLF